MARQTAQISLIQYLLLIAAVVFMAYDEWILDLLDIHGLSKQVLSMLDVVVFVACLVLALAFTKRSS